METPNIVYLPIKILTASALTSWRTRRDMRREAIKAFEIAITL